MITMAAPGVDTEPIIRDLYLAVEKKRADGVYKAEGLEDAPRAPLSFRDNASFLSFYIQTLRENTFVDISDFEIVERRARFRKPLVLLKRLIWGLLRFYTYRLWSQQNQINGLLLAAVEGIHEQQTAKTALLEARIQALEEALRSRQAG